MTIDLTENDMYNIIRALDYFGRSITREKYVGEGVKETMDKFLRANMVAEEFVVIKERK